MLSETSRLILGIIGNQLEQGDEKGRKEYGVSIDDAEDVKYNWNMEAMAEMADALKYQQKEIEFLKKRNKELRQKTYINVYDENLKMQDEIKALKHENEVKFNDLVKYEKTIEQLRKELMQVGKLCDKFYHECGVVHEQVQNLYEENQKLKGVIASVQTFANQFTK